MIEFQKKNSHINLTSPGIVGGEGGYVDLSNYYTKAEVDRKIENIDIPEVDMTGYATEAYVDAAIGDIDIPEVDLSNYYTKEEANAAIMEALGVIENGTY